MRKTRFILAAAIATAAVSGGATGVANAATADQTVAGTALSTLALVATPVTLDTQFQPGQTASNSAPGAVTVSSTGPWSLSVADPTNGGFLKSGALGTGAVCSPATGAQSETQTAHQLSLSIAGTAGITTGSAGKTVGSSSVAVASGTLADALTATYNLVLDPTEQLLTGCAYATTVTYTAS